MMTTEAPDVVHDLKVLPAFFEALRDGRKTYEVRRLDRPYAVGDTLVLHEWGATHDYPDGRYTGREVRKRISHMLAGSPWMPDGTAVLGLEPPDYAATLAELRAALFTEREALQVMRGRAEAAEARVRVLGRHLDDATAQLARLDAYEREVGSALDEATRAVGWGGAGGHVGDDIRAFGSAHARALARIVELEGFLIEEQEVRADYGSRLAAAEANLGVQLAQSKRAERELAKVEAERDIHWRALQKAEEQLEEAGNVRARLEAERDGAFAASNVFRVGRNDLRRLLERLYFAGDDAVVRRDVRAGLDVRSWPTQGEALRAAEAEKHRPTCGTCSDTHQMTLHSDGEERHRVPCTMCPVPCERCRKGGVGAYCATTPCMCTCHHEAFWTGADIRKDSHTRAIADDDGEPG